ncbi:MAG: branched-chain amino acid transport system permease protein [Actinomycetota bacterium]|jgi:branched-chain amino acid transport system permease protein|nr:branched-chain amino acid transport system permease protein [Actinomycetota bacterium]
MSTTTQATKPEVASTTSRRDQVRRLLPWVLGVAAVLGCLGLQSQLFLGQQRTVAAIFMFVALSQAWNLIGGFAGYASFGQVAFFGVGGYFTAVAISHWHLSFWVSLILSGIVAALFGTLIGIPLLRLKGHYFAIATLGVAEGMREVVTNLPDLTGGGAGITVPTVGVNAITPYLGNDGFYLLFLALAAMSVLIGGLVARNKFGYALRAIHQDEDAAASMGINTTRMKVLAFALSGFITGLVGASYAFQQVTIFPQRLFDVDITVLMVIMVVIGGSGTVLGPLIGAVALQLLSEFLRENFTDLHTFILGAIIILAVILLPQGLVNYVREARRTGEFSLLANVRKHRL